MKEDVHGCWQGAGKDECSEISDTTGPQQTEGGTRVSKTQEEQRRGEGMLRLRTCAAATRDEIPGQRRSRPQGLKPSPPLSPPGTPGELPLGTRLRTAGALGSAGQPQVQGRRVDQAPLRQPWDPHTQAHKREWSDPPVTAPPSYLNPSQSAIKPVAGPGEFLTLTVRLPGTTSCLKLQRLTDGGLAPPWTRVWRALKDHLLWQLPDCRLPLWLSHPCMPFLPLVSWNLLLLWDQWRGKIKSLPFPPGQGVFPMRIQVFCVCIRI